MSITNDELKALQSRYNECQNELKSLWTTFENRGGQVMWFGRVDDSDLQKAYLAYDIEAMSEVVKEYKQFLEAMALTQSLD